MIPDHPKVNYGKTGVLIVNLGTPDSTSWWDIRKYLKEFLSDRRVIEVNPLIWQVILNLFILTFRPSKTARAYKEIWMKDINMSPLRYFTESQAKKLSKEISNNDLIIDFEIVYKNPLIRTRRKAFRFNNCDLTSLYNSRTFCLYDDIDKIKNMGLAKGGSLENAIVVKEDKILNEDGLRHRHEFVEHKILDCLGDLMLSGYRIFGHIKTSQGGHALTNKLLVKFFSDRI